MKDMESICKFMPVKNYTGNIKTINFVLESKFHKLKQPFYYPVNHLFLVISGEGTLKINNKEFALCKGSLFFSFPQHFHEIEASEDFMYIYISFMGESIQGIFSELEISAENPVYYNFEYLIDFWMNSIRRITRANSNLLTEGVLLYTLSFLSSREDHIEIKSESESNFDLIVYYIDSHYTDPDISLKKISDIFSYTPKYLSKLFSKNMNMTFSGYINNLRVQHACSLIEDSVTSVSEISSACGFSDPLYFSKVFKKTTGFSPVTYIKRRDKETNK
ncbi:MAG: helix-turn-helix transcriptional regulator [Clostridia bacterium]|nr:helix-turn-helix transcriptional regulator [Clostridia bacterium]